MLTEINKHINTSLLLFFCAMLSISYGIAQPGVTTEKAVKLQSSFIAAMQEKILGHDKKAIDLFAEILEKDPKNHAAVYQLSLLYTKIENHEKAFELIQKANQIEPDNPYYLHTLANQYEKQKVYTAAVAIYQKLHDKNLMIPEWYESWANLFINSNQTENAIEVYDLIENNEGLSEDLTRKKYDLYIGLGKSKKALAELNKLSQSDPENTKYLYWIAMHHRNDGKEAKTREVLQFILDLDPEDTKAKLAMAEKLKRSGSDDQYLASISSLISNPDIELNIKIQELQPYVDKLQARSDESLSNQLMDIGDALEKAHPDQAPVKRIRASIFRYSGFPHRAIEELLTATQMAPADWDAWVNLYHLLVENHQFSKLYTSSQRALDYYPVQGLNYYMSGLASFYLDNYQTSANDLQEALMMLGNDSSLKLKAKSLLGYTICVLQGWEQGRKYFNEVKDLNLTEENIESLCYYWMAKSTTGQELAPIETAISKAMDLFQNNQVTYTAAFIQFKKGDFSTAKDILESVKPVERDHHPIILNLLGDIHAKSGMTAEAIKYWKQAQENGLDDSILLKNKIINRQVIE